MGTGIQICGLNGCGKSTLGRALANKIGFHFIDIETLFFPNSNSDDSYQNPKSREKVEKLLAEEMQQHHNFVFAAVKGNYGKNIVALYDYVIMIEVPKNIRSQRIRTRSFQKFGNRMLPGGDLHMQEEAFFQMAESRPNEYIEDWLQALNCPILRVDGTKPIADNLAIIIQAMGIRLPNDK